MLKSITKLFGGSDEKVIKKMQPDVDEINEFVASFNIYTRIGIC